MNPIKTLALAAGILVSLFSSVGCAANSSFIASPSNEVFASSESDASHLYQKGQQAMDKGDWKKASNYFNDLIEQDTKHTDAALYWKAYSLYRAGKKSSANRSLKKLFKGYKDSRWINEGKALQAEIRGVKSADYNDDEMKEIALNSLLHASPDRALPILKKTLSSNNSDDVKEMALFVLSQIGSPEARQMIETLALDNNSGELQKNAIHMLAISGDAKSRNILSNLYNKISDPEIREEILMGFMISGEKDKLLQAAKTESNPELRGSAAELLGQLGAAKELLPLYKNEQSVLVKESIISAMMISQNSSGILYIIENEENPELLSESIQMLGVMGDAESNKVLAKLWKEKNTPEVRIAIMEAWMIKGDVDAIADIARTVTNKEEKIQAIEFLGITKGRDVLREMYKTETDHDIKEQLIESLMMTGDLEILNEILENESDDELLGEAINLAAVFGNVDTFEKLTNIYKETSNINIKNAIIESHIVRNNTKGLVKLLKEESEPELLETIIETLGVVNGGASVSALAEFYENSNNSDLKSSVLESFMVQGNADLLIKVFRTEKDPELKREAVKLLSMINTKESRAIMLELLEKE